MNVLIVSCSQRPNSQSSRISDDLKKRLQNLDTAITARVVELLPETLPLWNPEVFSTPSLLSKWTLLADLLRESSALIFVVPEWGGMAPPAIKNLLLFASQKEVGHKPCLLCAISSSRGGAFPISELRTSGYKNNRILMLPEHLIIRDCEKQNLNQEPKDDDARYLQTRVDKTLELLLEYSKIMQPMRESKIFIDYMAAYSNGMS